MPIWVIYHPEDTFTTLEDKQALSESITTVYTTPTSSLPAFYVSVYFIPVPKQNVFVGGKVGSNTERPFIRLTVDHIAVKLPDNDSDYKRTTDKIDKALKPYIEDKGYDWEYHVTETERRLWKINGMAPPPWKSDGERIWREENRPVPL